MLLKNGLVYDRDSGDLIESDLRIKGDKIAEIADKITPEPGERAYEVSGKYVLPGVIDSHTHFQLNSRGTVAIDDFYQGTKSAAYGGVTTFIDYADQGPESLISGLKARLDEARDKAVIDYNLHLVVGREFDPEHQLEQLYKLPEHGVSSLKLFTTYRDIYMLDDSRMRAVFKAAAKAGLVVTVHSEDNQIIEKKQDSYRERGQTDYKYHPEIRPGKAEKAAIDRLAEFARDSGAHLYIVHLSSKEGYQAARKAAESGVKITLETTPHYLLLTGELLKESTARYNFMTPPLRSRTDNRVLWEGLSSGQIQVVATDHCAFSPEQKQQGTDVFDTLPGIPGVETLFPLLYTHGYCQDRLTLDQLVSVISRNPARIFGLYPRKGSLRPGTDADILVYDPEPQGVLRAANLHSRARHTPYQGMRVKGKAYLTIVRGQPVVEKGQFTGDRGYGQFIRAETGARGG